MIGGFSVRERQLGQRIAAALGPPLILQLSPVRRARVRNVRQPRGRAVRVEIETSMTPTPVALFTP